MLPEQYRKKEPSYFCRFTFNQFFTLLVIEIFTLFFIFYLGAHYGRELLGFEVKTQAQNTEEFPELKTTNPNVIATTQDPEIKAMAKDLLKAAPTPDLKERVANLLQESGKEAVVPQKAQPQTAQPQPQAQPAQPPPVIQTAPANAHFSIQVGSYENVDEAHSMVQVWKEKGYPAFLVSADIPDKGRWYRVRIGAFEDKDSAKAYLNDLVAKEDIEAFIAVQE